MFREAIDSSAKQALGIVGAMATERRFYLAGGTAAAIQLGHRISVDLDFFSEESFDPDELSRFLKTRQIQMDRQQVKAGTLEGTVAGAVTTFLLYPYPLIAHPIQFEEINLAHLLDIGLMKMTAIASRGAKKDFVDRYFILLSLGKPHLFEEFVRKFPPDRLDLYHYARSLTYFEDAEADPDPHMLVEWNWSTVKRFFRDSVKQLHL